MLLACDASVYAIAENAENFTLGARHCACVEWVFPWRMSQRCIGVGVTGLISANESLIARSTRKYRPKRLREADVALNLELYRRREPDVAANEMSPNI